MILELCLDLRHRLDVADSPAAVEKNLVTLRAVALPFDVDPFAVEAVILSRLFEEVSDRGERQVLGGVPVGNLLELPAPPAAEHARLVSKGRLLYEHCMATAGHVCVVGFFEHEVTRSEGGRRVVLDLLGWIVEQRIGMMRLEGEEPREVASRLAQARFMIDMGVGLVHALAPEHARELAGGEPDAGHR